MQDYILPVNLITEKMLANNLKAYTMENLLFWKKYLTGYEQKVGIR